ncbi:MAG: cysteine desulfurase family protein [Treponemataceae bacterium]
MDKLTNTEFYFDWAATAPLDYEICHRALQKTSQCFANPSSLHTLGNQAKELLSNARKKCAKNLGVKESQIIFTSGGTESNYLPILSLLQKPISRCNTDNSGSIIVSAIEHASVREQVKMMKNCGFNVIQIPPEKNGIINAKKLLEKVQPDTRLVCVIAVNNETGAIQPINEIADGLVLLSKTMRKPKFHVDGVQAVGKIPFSLNHQGIDTVSISAHKIAGPRGCGILYMKDRQEPFLRGGGQEQGLRSGTENIFGAIAIAECLKKYTFSNEVYESQKKMTDNFLEEIEAMGAVIIPQSRKNESHIFSPWIVQATFQKIPGEVMVRALNEKGVFISTGSACSGHKKERPILDAMKIPSEISQNAVRFSFGSTTKQENIQKLLHCLAEVIKTFT